jgi:YesN/AraC family two-component response regulator
LKNKILKKFFDNFTNKRTFYQIFIYSIAISSIILLLATIILYNNFKKTTIKEIQNKSIDQLKQTMAVFNSLHSLIISTSVQLNADPFVYDLLYKKKLSKYSISLALDRLDSYLASYPLIHSIFVYNSQKNEYYSTLHNMRIEFCKKLLQNTKLSIKDIAVRSGFINYNYFFTAFKKDTGLTPELYRKKNIYR